VVGGTGVDFFIMEVPVRFMLIAVLGLVFVGCAPAEYKCPDGLIPLKYARHTDHKEHGVTGHPVEVHSSDIECGRHSLAHK
jgi:hypothetical protein